MCSSLPTNCGQQFENSLSFQSIRHVQIFRLKEMHGIVFERRESDQKCSHQCISKNCSKCEFEPKISRNKPGNVKFANLHWNNLKTPKSVQKCPHECKSKICSKKYSIFQKLFLFKIFGSKSCIEWSLNGANRMKTLAMRSNPKSVQKVVQSPKIERYSPKSPFRQPTLKSV
jgi:hypothetical protein